MPCVPHLLTPLDRHAGSALLAPLAIRAFTPVSDGLWRGQLGKTENLDSAR